jgi:cytochrome c5
VRFVNFRARYAPIAVAAACIMGLGTFAGASMGQDQPRGVIASSRPISAMHVSFYSTPIGGIAAQSQDATPPATPPATSPATAAPGAPAAAAKPPIKAELPEGEGKPIATEYCQDCHRLTNLLTAHKNADEWRDTVHLMMDRGARLPDDQIDTLVKYLAKNFTPASATPAQATPEAKSAPDAQAAPSTIPSVPSAASAAPAPKNKIELPEGDAKPIATEYCQDCHRLSNLTMAHKTSDEWNDTVHLMMDRGARLPDDKIDALVQYLAKNFGPAASGTGAPAGAGLPPPANSTAPATAK